MDPLTTAKIAGTVIQQRKKILPVVITVITGFFLMFFMIFSGDLSKETSNDEAVNLPETVLRWENDVRRIAKKNKVEEYVPNILGIIMVESRGEGLDIMQSGESANLGQNGMVDPISSLEQGIKYFASIVTMANDLKIDVWSAVQAYNFGANYVNFVAENGKKHSTDVAAKYSKDVVAPSLGNSGGITYNYANDVSKADGRTYLYLNGGNFHYVNLVKQYVTTASGSGSNLTGGKYGYPFKDKQPVTSGFSIRLDPFTGLVDSHTGQDFGAPEGTAILAAKDGKVLQGSDTGDSYGIAVVLEHNDSWKTRYGHMSKSNTTIGSTVKKGQVIGYVGSTGRSTGPHLHFEILSGKNGIYDGHVDPAPLIGLK